MSDGVLLILIVLALSALAACSACQWAPARPSLSKKEERHLDALRGHLDSRLPSSEFHRLALVLWQRRSIHPKKLNGSTRFGNDFGLSPQELSALIRGVGRDMGSQAVSQNASHICTFRDLVRHLESEYLKTKWLGYYAEARRLESSGDDSASRWRQRAYEVLSDMKQRGLLLSSEDACILRQLQGQCGRSRTLDQGH